MTYWTLISPQDGALKNWESQWNLYVTREDPFELRCLNLDRLQFKTYFKTFSINWLYYSALNTFPNYFLTFRMYHLFYRNNGSLFPKLLAIGCYWLTDNFHQKTEKSLFQSNCLIYERFGIRCLIIWIQSFKKLEYFEHVYNQNIYKAFMIMDNL